LKSFLAAYRVDAIVVAHSAKGIASDLPASLGIKPIEVGGVSIYRLSREANPSHVARLPDLQRAAAEGWLRLMLCAGQRFILGGHDPATLQPASAYALGLLPPSAWSDSLDLLIAGLPHGATNGLWLGPGNDDSIEIGVPASGDAARVLASRYGPDAIRILYPYPNRYSAAASGGNSVDFLLITLHRAALNRCRDNSTP
jgi:hypothetical protein